MPAVDEDRPEPGVDDRAKLMTKPQIRRETDNMIRNLRLRIELIAGQQLSPEQEAEVRGVIQDFLTENFLKKPRR